MAMRRRVAVVGGIVAALAVAGVAISWQMRREIERGVEELRATAQRIPHLDTQPAPADWPQISLGQVTVQVPPAPRELKTSPSSAQTVVAEYSSCYLRLSKGDWTPDCSPWASSPELRDYVGSLDEVDVRAVALCFPADPERANHRSVVFRQLQKVGDLTRPSGLSRVRVFRQVENGVKGLVAYCDKYADVHYWTHDERWQGTLAIISDDAREQEVLSQRIVGSLRLAPASAAASQPSETLIEQCRRVLTTSQPN